MQLQPIKKYSLSFTIDNVYKGQIKLGSLKWEITNLNDDVGTKWISEDDKIEQSFTKDDAIHTEDENE